MERRYVVEASAGKQLGVAIDNRAGTLAEVCCLLGEAGINVYGLTLAEGIGHGYLRMVVDRGEDAMRLLDEHDYVAWWTDILLLEIDNRAGSLGAVAQALARAGINVEYAYCAGGPKVERGLVVVRVDDVPRALEMARGLCGESI